MKSSFREVVGNVVVDLGGTDLSFSPVQGVKSDDVAESQFIRLMSFELHRKATKTSGGWVLARRLGYSNTTIDNWRRAVSWLESENDDELRRLCSSGVAFADLSDSTKELFARLADNPGLQQKMANGDFAATCVRIVPVVTATDYSGQSKSFPADLSVHSNYETQLRNRLAADYHRPSATKETIQPATGSLDLSKGDVLSLEAITQLYKKSFNKELHYDGRLGQTYYYLQGRFDAESLLATLKEVTQPIGTDLNTDSLADYKSKVSALLKRRVAGLIDPSTLPKGLSADDMMSGRQFAAKDLFSTLPFLESGLENRNISTSASVTLSAGLSLQMQAEGAFLEPDAPSGTSPLENGWAICFGGG